MTLSSQFPIHESWILPIHYTTSNIYYAGNAKIKATNLMVHKTMNITIPNSRFLNRKYSTCERLNICQRLKHPSVRSLNFDSRQKTVRKLLLPMEHYFSFIISNGFSSLKPIFIGSIFMKTIWGLCHEYNLEVFKFPIRFVEPPTSFVCFIKDYWEYNWYFKYKRLYAPTHTLKDLVSIFS